jgi:hypothetical protein
MVLLTWLFVSTLAHAADERIAVAVLPPLATQGAAALSPRAVERALADAVASRPDFRFVPLTAKQRDAQTADPGCRDHGDCLRRTLPADAELVIDTRLLVHAQVPSVELRLRKPTGDWSRRMAVAVQPNTAAREAADAVPLLLTGWARPARLYGLARDGDKNAAAELRTRFPDSPWTQALNETPAP